MTINITQNIRSRELFKIRYSFDSLDICQKDLEKFDNDIKNKLDRIMEKETRQINYRTLQYIEDLLNEISNDVDKKISKLKSKNRLAYNLWLNEKKEAIENIKNKVNEDEFKIVELLADLDKDITPETRHIIFLLGEVNQQFNKTYDAINEALTYERFSRRVSQISKMVRIFNAIILVVFRLADLDRHWKKEEKRKILENLLHWDLQTLNELTLSLKVLKKFQGEHMKLENELIEAIWGET